MATQIQFRRGTKTQHNSFTGATGEVTVNTTNLSLHVHDGVTAGGTELARADLSNHSGVGVLTATTFSGNVVGNLTGNVTGNLTGNVTGNVNSSGVSTFSNVVVGGATTDLIVVGDARITGILTVGSSSITIDGVNNQVNVGSGVTIHHIDGMQVGENTVHSSGLDINQITVSGVSTFSTGTGIGTVNIGFGNTALFVDGDTRITGILTIGASSITLNGIDNTIKIGTGLTLTESGSANYAGVVTALGFVGDLTGDVTGNADTATALETPRTFEITGDIVSSVISFDGSGNVSLAATIQPNSVGLGTDTTGEYVSNITGTTNQITVTSGIGEGSTPTLSIPDQFTAPQDVTVTRDLQVDRNLNVNGSITIGGTSATLFTTELKVYDPDIVLGIRTDENGEDISTDNTANHGGIAVASTEGTPLISLYDVGIGETNPATYKKIMWFKSGTFSGLGTDAWISNYAIGIGSTQVPDGVRLSAGGMQVTDSTIIAPQLNVSGIVTASGFVGPLTGNVTGTATSTTNIPNLSGDITSANTVTTLATVNSNVGSFGDGGAIPRITVNAKGLVTGVTTSAVSPPNNGTLTLNTSGTGLSGSTTFSANQASNTTFTVTSNATSSNTGSTIVARDASGNFTAGTITASDFNSTSDINLKKDIEVIQNATEILTEINGVKFSWKENDVKSVGVIAQDVEKVLPELVNTTDKGKKTVNYDGLIGVLIESIKEQQKQIDSLQSQLNNLMNQQEQ
jgi:hypothetical protein